MSEKRRKKRSRQRKPSSEGAPNLNLLMMPGVRYNPATKSWTFMEPISVSVMLEPGDAQFPSLGELTIRMHKSTRITLRFAPKVRRTNYFDLPDGMKWLCVSPEAKRGGPSSLVVSYLRGGSRKDRRLPISLDAEALP